MSFGQFLYILVSTYETVIICNLLATFGNSFFINFSVLLQLRDGTIPNVIDSDAILILIQNFP